MTGKKLLEKIKSYGYRNAELAQLLGISEQAFNSKLKTTDVKVSLLEDLARVTNRSVYEWLDFTAPASPTADGGWKEKYIEILERYNVLSDKLTACMEEKQAIKDGSAKGVQSAPKPAKSK